MILGRVVGEVWAARRHLGLGGRKLLIVEPHYWYGPPFEVAHLIAVDTLGAGPGDEVVICLGEPARQSLLAQPSPRGSEPGYATAAMLPIEAAVMAIVDQAQICTEDGTEAGGSNQRRFGRPLRTLLPQERLP